MAYERVRGIMPSTDEAFASFPDNRFLGLSHPDEAFFPRKRDPPLKPPCPSTLAGKFSGRSFNGLAALDVGLFEFNVGLGQVDDPLD